MLAICFAAIALFEWKQLHNKPAQGKKAFWWLFSLTLVWNIGANFISWWPNPNRFILYLLGWI
ncbi:MULTISPECIES: hypothetical protein [Paenibacillus]|uniref:Uncharacterized protein n=1 Tax=Paenibacillus vini TaxID=1476024 RepID=A0ABQ4MD18_9BACL|nr:MULTISPECIES: hypothetical protein [Paenibacillus]MBQ4897945.1 hypothetical protein [Paenibacillus sp. Marseille-P2973]GIP53878.1 hypothetical protein J42TS3_29130 [Paenibacillus vini]